ncbi:hypothetical protein B0T24DRAFT_712305 [Lasiosphaeria ovina]|uniref:Uncharacterized protein n=1 Tax=Lasiosphaeria ovina TaxID=92902 RepID=A0AAE0MZT9_9PEZI|nr:hypothetical protein B0T24DRAFT_712305 [Lasiosphaeria ovina]
MKNSASLESSRVRGSTREAYEDFYKRQAFQIKDKKVKPANIANMDEHGMQELETRAGKPQPLDRSVFSPLMNYFRQNTKALAGFTSSAPINKQRFLFCYRDASARGMSARNILSGFRNTGIWPYSPARILDDPEAFVNKGALPARPSPPPTTAPNDDDKPLKTPHGSQDVK